MREEEEEGRVGGGGGGKVAAIKTPTSAPASTSNRFFSWAPRHHRHRHRHRHYHNKGGGGGGGRKSRSWTCCSWRVLSFFTGHHQFVQGRTMLPPSRIMSIFCGSVLAMLGLISLTIGPLFDLDLTLRHHTHNPQSLALPTTIPETMRALQQPPIGISAFREILPDTIWASSLAKYYRGCSAPTKSFSRRISEWDSNGYIFVETSGGLNQQRIGIVDVVVVARILNATLIVPLLDHGSFWKDSSNFSDIFDVEWFIAALAPDVVIVKEAPPRLRITREMFYSTRAPRKSEPQFYVNNVLPLLRRKKAIRLTKFDYRLASDLDKDLQRLRCRANYNALQFTATISDIGNSLVRRLKQRSGRYIALHLRFEPDMLAFTGCYYGGGEKERGELGELRKRWSTLSPMRLDNERRSGKCPLTPEEVGLMLRALGFESDSQIYVASGVIYGGEETLAPLRALFPNLHTKDTLASRDELEPFTAYANRMAAIDYIVCEKSDVFITNYNGNMARVLAGSRRYYGHKRTIQPNVKKLGSLFLSRLNMTWKAFSSKIRMIQKGYIGEPSEVRLGGEFFEFPDSCICKEEDAEPGAMAAQQLREMSAEVDGNVGKLDSDSLEENLLVQQADLENEANAVTRTDERESDENSWLSD